VSFSLLHVNGAGDLLIGRRVADIPARIDRAALGGSHPATAAKAEQVLPHHARGAHDGRSGLDHGENHDHGAGGEEPHDADDDPAGKEL